MWPFTKNKNKPFKYEFQHRKWDKLNKRILLSRILCTTGGALVCAAIVVPIMLTQCKNKDKPVTPNPPKPIVNTSTSDIIGLTELLIPFKTTYEYKCNIDGATITAQGLPDGFSFDGHTLTTPSSISSTGTFILTATTNDGLVCSRTISYFSDRGQMFTPNKIILIEGGVNNYWLETKDVDVIDNELQFALTDDDKNLTTGVYFSDLSGLSFTKISYFLAYCNALTSVDLSALNNVTEIGNDFLTGCLALTSVDLSAFNNVTSIDLNFLAFCSGLTSVDLSVFTNVNSIGEYFLSNTALISVDLSAFSSVTEIGNNFLSYCMALTSVNLSAFSSVTEIKSNFLYYCVSLTSVDLSAFTQAETIGDGFFYYCISLTSVDLSAFTQVQTIGADFLYQCLILASVNLSAFSRVTTIGNDFLYQCSSLTSVDLSVFTQSVFTQVQTIGSYFLSYSSALTSVDLSSFTQVQTIGEYFLSGCTGLTSVNIGNKDYSAVTFESGAMSNVTNLSTNKIFGTYWNEFKGKIGDPINNWTQG